MEAAKKPHRLQAISMQSLETVVSDGWDNGVLPLSDLKKEMPSEIKEEYEDLDDEDNELRGIEELYDSKLERTWCAMKWLKWAIVCKEG